VHRPLVQIHGTAKLIDEARHVIRAKSKVELRFFEQVVAASGEDGAGRNYVEQPGGVVVAKTPAGDVDRRGRGIDQLNPIAGHAAVGFDFVDADGRGFSHRHRDSCRPSARRRGNGCGARGNATDNS